MIQIRSDKTDTVSYFSLKYLMVSHEILSRRDGSNEGPQHMLSLTNENKKYLKLSFTHAHHLIWSSCSKKISGPGCSKLTTSLINVSLEFQVPISEQCRFLLILCEKIQQQKYQCSVRVPPSDTLELLFQINFQTVTSKVYRLYVTCKIHTSCIDSVNIS